MWFHTDWISWFCLLLKCQETVVDIMVTLLSLYQKPFQHCNLSKQLISPTHALVRRKLALRRKNLRKNFQSTFFALKLTFRCSDCTKWKDYNQAGQGKSNLSYVEAIKMVSKGFCDHSIPCFSYIQTAWLRDAATLQTKGLGGNILKSVVRKTEKVRLDGSNI